ncbi:hypothetical protein Mgra_00002526 [Meloidogyne graminicola]|uniref:Uncharacterized protein n=1 Tax=Meloidogyne graminicola TaxID=189291 RepID=A0A8S9ZY33_9BILA|nr:hypothetical protein Mgra_00002526 [Meloidogyne graminicola]
MVLICDVCRQDISLGGNANPTICLFPCFHKYCERCKAQILSSTARSQNGAESRVSCKLCNQNFLLNVLYDYNENQIEKIFCLHCNIKNKATVEWRCKSCQDRYLCAHCSQPHYHSGHELEPVMKPNIPLRSQCTSHSNILATYLCSCQARLCDYCLNNHADGSVLYPHEQRFAYDKLAERARNELDTIRRQSQKEFEQLERLKEKISKNKTQISVQANQARSAVANQIVELTNTIIRRGNDIIISIDQTEESKIKNCNQLEQEMRHWTDRLRKIESFTENALLTVQQDHPGMWSASMFAQSALFQINKRRDLAKNTLESFERLPVICYQNGPIMENLNNAIKSFGQLNLDGAIRVIPAEITPQSAHMFSINNSNTQQNNLNNEASIIETSTTQHNKKQQTNPLQNVSPIIRSPPILNTSNINVSVNIQQQINRTITSSATNVLNMSTSSSSVPLPPTSTPLSIPSNHSIPQQQIIQHSEHFGSSPPINTGIIQSNLFQPMSTSRQQRPPQLFPSNGPLPPMCNIGGSPPTNISLPNTPLTPIMPPDNLQIIRQPNPIMTMTIQQQQQQQQYMFGSQQRLMQQTPQIMQRQQQQQQFRLQHPNIPTHNSVLMSQQGIQQCLPQSQSNNNNVLFNQQQAYMMQQQQQQIIGQGPQQQIMLHHHPPVLSPQFNHQVFDSSSQQHIFGEVRPPPIMLRIPNPRQHPFSDANQNNSIPSSSSSVIHPIAPSNTQNYLNSGGASSLEQMMEMTSRVSAVHPSFNLINNILVNQNSTNIPSKQPSAVAPIIVDLIDDDEEEEKMKQQNLEPNTVNDITEKIVSKEDSVQQLSQNNPNLIKALRLNKPQSVAADSTVGNQSTIESPNIQLNSNIGIKRKPELTSIDDNENRPTEKRLATETTENSQNTEEQKRPKNTSPPIDLISTTTAENGEEQEDGSGKEDNNATNQSEFQQEMQQKNNTKKQQNSKARIWEMVKPLNEATTSSGLNKSKTENKSNINENNTINKAEESSITATGDDMWDDYCYVCSQGCDETTGSLGCCSSCPRVFHARCHIPKIIGLMEDLPDDWKCSICVESEPLTQQSQEFGEREKLICSKVFLACFEDSSQVELFINKVPSTESDYHAIIKNPIWLQAIGEKINSKTYTCVVKFLEDMNLLFRNFSTFNMPNHPLAAKGKSVYTRYIQAVKKFMPFYQKHIWIYVSLYNIRFNSSQASSSVNLTNEEEDTRIRLKGIGKKRGSSKAKSQTPA